MASPKTSPAKIAGTAVPAASGTGSSEASEVTAAAAVRGARHVMMAAADDFTAELESRPSRSNSAGSRRLRSRSTSFGSDGIISIINCEL